MGLPVTALLTFGVYGCVMVWYAVPGFGHLPAVVTRPDEWIADLSLALPVTATVLYLSLCFFGPKVMAKREAFDPKGFMLVYNGYQTVFNIITVAIFVAELYRTGTKAWGGRLAWSNKESFWILLAIWLHYNNKYLELLDTVFMVRTRKERGREGEEGASHRGGATKRTGFLFSLSLYPLQPHWRRRRRHETCQPYLKPKRSPTKGKTAFFKRSFLPCSTTVLFRLRTIEHLSLPPPPHAGRRALCVCACACAASRGIRRR